jgi:hypothetical protein
VGIARVTLVIVLAGLVVVGCFQQDAVPTPATRPAPTAVGAPISKTTWSDGLWPFTVADGVLKCYSEDSMVTFTAGGVEYGLNATARRFGNFRDIAEIMPDGPDGYVEANGMRQRVPTHGVSLEGIYSRARALCS